MEKESEYIKRKLSETDNDLRGIGLGKQLIRAERNESFEDNWLPKFKEKLGESIFKDNKKCCYTIIYSNETYDFYPKANKVLIRSKNKWKTAALRFLMTTLKIQTK